MAPLHVALSLPQTNINFPIYQLNCNKPSYSRKCFYTPTTNDDRKCNYSYDVHPVTKSFRNATSVPYTEGEGSVEDVKYQSRDGRGAEVIPNHVAILFTDHHQRMDVEKDLPSEVGYGADFESLKDIAQICCELGIKVLSICMFSFNNSLPQKEEIDHLAKTIMNLNLNMEELTRNDIRISIIGKRKAIPDSLLETITRVEETTKNNKSLHIINAFYYTDSSDIIQACIALAEKVKDGRIKPEDIDESAIQQELETKCTGFPNLDLMIRTGGKFSVDDFMLWQLAYSELYFVEKDALEFNKTDFVEALDVYQKRHRRFGGDQYNI